jgi:predicted metalloprotease with PDZ domain
MYPYDYTQENYFKTGYVAEGVTTYMGDYFLLASGVFSKEQFLKEFSEQIQKHLDNYGRFNYSVAESSFDTWLDGYTPGIPARKVSIYTEGFLLAFIADILIRKHSKHQYSLHNVMYALYHDFYKNNKGYTENDYKNLLEKFSGISFDEYFEKLVNGTHSYFELLNEALIFIGLELNIFPSEHCHENNYGIKLTEQSDKIIISGIHPELAENSYLNTGDQILAMNNHPVNNDIGKWFNDYNGNDIEIQVTNNFGTKNVKLLFKENAYYKKCVVSECKTLNHEQTLNFEKWLNP